MDLPKKAFGIDFHVASLTPVGAGVNPKGFYLQRHKARQARLILPRMLE